MQRLRMNPTDEEPDLIIGIKRRLLNGDITPAQAVREASGIESSRSSHYR